MLFKAQVVFSVGQAIKYFSILLDYCEFENRCSVIKRNNKAVAVLVPISMYQTKGNSGTKDAV